MSPGKVFPGTQGFIFTLLTYCLWQDPLPTFMMSYYILWCWERLKAGGVEDDRRWDGWMAPPTRWTWIWTSSRSWWWMGKPGVLQSMGLQSWTWLSNWTELIEHLSPSGSNFCEGRCHFAIWTTSPSPTLVEFLQNRHSVSIVSKNQAYPKRFGIIHNIQKNEQQVLNIIFGCHCLLQTLF